MSEQVDYDLIGSYNNQRYPSINGERTINLFEYIDPTSKKPKVLLPTSGLIDEEFIFTSATDGFRAQFVFQERMYCVIGANIYSVTQNGVVTKLTSSLALDTFVGYVGVDANTFQILFVDGNKGYIFDTMTDILVQITDTSFPTRPDDCAYLDGFFVVIQGQTNNFQLSEYNQGLIWGVSNTTFTIIGPPTELLTLAGGTDNFKINFPVTFSGTLPPDLSIDKTYYIVAITSTTISVSATLGGEAISLSTSGSGDLTISNGGEFQQAQISSHPGTIVACKTLHRKLFLFSQNFIEVWENQGVGANLPFRRNNNILMEVGTPAIWSIATGFDRLLFLSQDNGGQGAVMEIVGVNAVPVSNRALDYQIAQYAANPDIGVADASGIIIKENGLLFYRLNFTNANHTYVFNITMSSPDEVRWHEEETLTGNRHPAQTHGYFFGNNYYGDYLSPTMYLVDSQTFTNDGEQIKRTRIGKPICPGGYQRTRIDRFQIDVLQGNVAALNTGNIPINLLTESGYNLLTENNFEILLEQEEEIGGEQDLKIFLQYSKDGGQTFGDYIIAPMGKVGERTFRTCWRKLGVIPRGQAFVPKIEFYLNYPFVVLGAAWVFETLPE